MLGMEGPIPGGPLGKRPRALRLSPGIRLDCSCRERGEESEKVILRKEENRALSLYQAVFFLTTMPGNCHNKRAKQMTGIVLESENYGRLG